MRRVLKVLLFAALCFGVAILVWSQTVDPARTIWQTDGTNITSTALSTSSLDVRGDISLTGSPIRQVSVGDGILTLSTNGPNQAFLNSTGFWFLQVGEVDKINIAAGSVIVNEAGVDVNFRVESNAKPNAFFLEGSSGNVGVGGVPGAKLHVFDNVGEIMRFEQTGAGTPGSFIRWIDTGGQTAFLGHSSSSNDQFHVMNQTATGSLILGTASANALTIDSNQDATFAQVVKINDILILIPKASAPGACFIGDFYVDTSGAACACSTNNVWSNMHATGTCV